MMRLPGRKFARRLLRPVAKALMPGAVILGYHRVADCDWDPLRLAVSPENFASQLDVLKQMREIVTVGELALKRAAGERLENYAALTFDDGYSDFADTVLPIIESRQVPATVFVTTGNIGRSFWWDEVAALLAPDSRNRTAASLEIPRGNGTWRFSDLDEPRSRARAASEICNGMACAAPDEIIAVVEALRAWRGTAGALQPDFGPLNETQLATLARQPLVEVAAHTMSHACLALLESDVQRREILDSKAALERSYGVEVRSFSYPNGSFSDTTRGLVEALGFDCACTSNEGTVGRRTDAYRMPRIWAPDSAAPDFRRWLSQWASQWTSQRAAGPR